MKMFTDGMDGIKSVLQFLLYFDGRYFLDIYVSTKNMLPRLLWVLKFNVKLGSVGHDFRNYNKYET